MSVLICTLCEQNRKPISESVEDIQQNLGARTSGYSSFLHNLICESCRGRTKKFTINSSLVIPPVQDIFVRSDVNYFVTVDDAGNYFLEAPIQFLEEKMYNHLAIINAIKEKIEALNPNDNHFSGGEVEIGVCHPILCTCGGHTFENIS